MLRTTGELEELLEREKDQEIQINEFGNVGFLKFQLNLCAKRHSKFIRRLIVIREICWKIT